MIWVNSTPHTAGPEAPGVAVSISSRRRWGIVGLLFSASMINYMDRATVSMALPSISSDLGLGPTAKGELLSAFFVSYALMQIPIGWCADRFNLKWLYAAILLIVGASLAGLATGNLIAILQDCAPPNEVGIWTGVQNFAGNIAGSVAPLTTGLLISWTGS